MIKKFIKKLFPKKDNTILTTGPVEVSNLSGVLVTADGRRIRGNITEPCIVCFPSSVKFVPISGKEDCRGEE